MNHTDGYSAGNWFHTPWKKDHKTNFVKNNLKGGSESEVSFWKKRKRKKKAPHLKKLNSDIFMCT